MFNLRHSCRRAARTSLALAAALSLLPAAGCATGWTSKRSDSPPGPVDGMVMRAGHVESDSVPEGGTAAAEFEGARKLYQDGEYGRAQSIFHRLARDKQGSLVLTEEALYYEADCLRLQGHYPKAAELYYSHLLAYPAGRHTTKARQRMFDIANYWLDDTRKYMTAVKERRNGERWFVLPVSFISFERTKPLFDCKGHALRLMENVYLTDPTGPLAEKALFFLGTIKFFEEEYRDADHFYTELVRHHPNGEYAPQAVEQSIICKQMATGGSEYDTRLVSEARELVDRARASYPELARKEHFLLDQLHSINQQQADKDWKIAEFYRRIGKHGSAYMMYEVVRRRHAGTEYARKAEERMREIDARRQRDGAVPPAPGAQPMPQQFPAGQPLGVPDRGAPQRLPTLPAGDMGRL